MSIADKQAPGGVGVHELIISAALGAFMGLIGFYITRAIAPSVESALARAGV